MAAAAPVAFFPGLLCDERLWSAPVAALGTRVNPWIAEFRRDASIADMVRRALSECPFERFSLAALSMGGYVAMEVMRQAPERVERLALLDTQARDESPDARERRLALMRLGEEDRLADVSERLMPLLLHASKLSDAKLTGLCRDMALSTGRDAFLRQQKAIMERMDSRASIAAIRCPTLVLCGDNDLLTPVDRHEEIAAAIPGAKLVKIPACGHMAPIEKPDAVVRALESWLGLD